MPSEIGGFSMVELHDGKVELHSEQSSEAHESGSEDEDQTRKTQDAKDAKDPKVANSKTARKNSDASSTRFVEVMYPSEDEDRAGPQSNAPTNSDRDPKDTNSEPANDVSPLVDRMSILKVDEYGIPTEQTTAQSSLAAPTDATVYSGPRGERGVPLQSRFDSKATSTTRRKPISERRDYLK